MEAEEILSMADDYMLQERNKDFGVEYRVKVAFMAGMTKGHMICAQDTTEQILDARKTVK